MAENSLNNFKLALESFGFMLLDQPEEAMSASAPTITSSIFIDIPDDQIGMINNEGHDPTYPNEVIGGYEAVRLLHLLRMAGLITTWHGFAMNSNIGAHVILTAEQSNIWYRWIDWNNNMVHTEQEMSNYHTFGY